MPLFPNPADRPKPVFHPPAFWEPIMHEYVLGLGSTRALAAKHGVRLSTLQARCQREGWVLERMERMEMALDDLADRQAAGVREPMGLGTAEPRREDQLA